jgi:hypothetical protein
MNFLSKTAKLSESDIAFIEKIEKSKINLKEKVKSALLLVNPKI